MASFCWELMQYFITILCPKFLTWTHEINSGFFHLIPELNLKKKIILISPLLTTEMICQKELLNTCTWILGKMCFVLCFNKMDQKTSFFSSVNFQLSLKGLHPYLGRNKELFFSTCLLGKLKSSWILCKNFGGCTWDMILTVFLCSWN